MSSFRSSNKKPESRSVEISVLRRFGLMLDSTFSPIEAWSATSQDAKAPSFAAGWIASNIEPGPFSADDPPIYDVPVSLFRRAAVQAGISEVDLIHALGPIPNILPRLLPTPHAVGVLRSGPECTQSEQNGEGTGPIPIEPAHQRCNCVISGDSASTPLRAVLLSG